MMTIRACLDTGDVVLEQGDILGGGRSQVDPLLGPRVGLSWEAEPVSEVTAAST